MNESLIRYIHKVAYEVARKSLSREDSEDLAGQVVYRMIKVGTPEHYHRAYIYKAAANAVADWYRKNKDEKTIIEEPSESDWTSLTETKAQLTEAIKRLPIDLQEIALYRIHGYSVEEVAEKMGIPEGTVKSKRHRIVNILRAELGEAFEDDDGGDQD